jgi:hypothetical protein
VIHGENIYLHLNAIYVSFALLMSVFFDGEISERGKGVKTAWVPLYALGMMYLFSKELAFSTWPHAVALISLGGSLFFASVQLFMQLEVPQRGTPPSEYTTNMFGFLTFSFITEPVILAAWRKGSLNLEDLPGLVDHDTCAAVWGLIRSARRGLLYRLYVPIASDCVLQFISQLVTSIAKYGTPLALGCIVWYVSNDGSPAKSNIVGFSMPIEVAVFLLFASPAVCAAADGQLYSRGRQVQDIHICIYSRERESCSTINM